MDSELGFFFGAYLLEGHAVKRAQDRQSDSHVAVIIATTCLSTPHRPTDRSAGALTVTDDDRVDRMGKRWGAAGPFASPARSSGSSWRARVAC
jgi:hypothetical protein